MVESRLVERLDHDEREEFYRLLNEPLAPDAPTDELRRILGV